MLVGAVQVGTYDQFRQMYRGMGIKNDLPNVFCAAMTSGLIYSIVTMPFETAKNRMAFQKADPVTGLKPYTGKFLPHPFYVISASLLFFVANIIRQQVDTS